jgi:hypothetical protein
MTALEIVRKFHPDVESVKDSNKPLIIEVTKKDAQSTAVKNHKDCAMAVACKRQLKADGVIVCLTTSYIIRGKQATRYKNTEAISREVTSFDRKAGFETGIYELARVPKSSRIGTNNKRHGKGKEKHYPPKFSGHRTDNVRLIGDRL